MTKVSVFHNISRDGSMGLNTVFRRGTEAPEGVRALDLGEGRLAWKEEGSGDERHELVWVFVYEAEGLSDAEVLYNAFEDFNVGENRLANAYRARRLRSLSVGDVVVIGAQAYSCERVGWKARKMSELRFVVNPAAAEEKIRERYEFRPHEVLSITVPLPA